MSTHNVSICGKKRKIFLGVFLSEALDMGHSKEHISFPELLISSFVFQVVGFIWGFICQQFSQTMYILIAGFVLSCLVRLFFF